LKRIAAAGGSLGRAELGRTRTRGGCGERRRRWGHLAVRGRPL